VNFLTRAPAMSFQFSVQRFCPRKPSKFFHSVIERIFPLDFCPRKLPAKMQAVSNNEKDAVRLMLVCRRGVKLGGPPREDQFGPANMPLKLSHALGQLRKLGLDRRG
jgi:hypothetical protein